VIQFLRQYITGYLGGAGDHLRSEGREYTGLEQFVTNFITECTRRCQNLRAVFKQIMQTLVDWGEYS
jgi:hypothetical protein